ncbi:MAG: hypothetical protein K2N51_17075 [Lachnospiraceae bacterium]|nr:hypothetical protein [Lachnospiraceae bacterium]
MRHIFYYTLIALISFAGIFFDINLQRTLVCIFAISFVNLIYTIIYVVKFIDKYKKSKAVQGFDIADPKLFDSINIALYIKFKSNVQSVIDDCHKNEDGSLTIDKEKANQIQFMLDQDYEDLPKSVKKAFNNNTTIFIDSILCDYKYSH